MVGFWQERQGKAVKDQRCDFDRDYARVVHSASFRRLQAKTQVLGLGDSDFYRTRLTHSIEVSQIGEGILRHLEEKYKEDNQILDNLPHTSLIRAICLAHDLGHPPFGHGGEVALNRCMLKYGGFEGNAQTLRVVTSLEPYHKSKGMNLCRRTLLGILKYPAAYGDVCNKAAYPEEFDSKSSNFRAEEFKPPKCYFDSEKEVVKWISGKRKDWNGFVEVDKSNPNRHYKTKHKSLDSSIMELADDIAYGVHDLEDAISIKFVRREQFEEFLCESKPKFEVFLKKSRIRDWEDFLEKLFSNDTWQRKWVIGRLVDFLVRGVKVDLAKGYKFECGVFGNRAKLCGEAEEVLGALQDFVFKKVIKDVNVQQLEFKGQKILTELFLAIAADPCRLLRPRDVSRYKDAEEGSRDRVICDYIAGMTDEYATKLYLQLFSPREGSVFAHW